MTQWYVKDLSKLTQISVQTLHHYDRIGLLEPSVRLANGYRLYSEKDLLKLQQIIALKFFGFELSQIKMLLAEEMDVIDHFSAQAQFLEDKAKSLVEASNTLKAIVTDCDHSESIPWETIIKSIGVYRMMQELEKTWAGKVFNSDELKTFANFQQELKSKYTENQISSFESEWAEIVKEVGANLSKDPSGDFGIALGKHCMDWVNRFYGKKYAGIRNSIWNKGFKNGLIDDEDTLPPKSFSWLDKAIEAYYRSRIYNILDQVDNNPSGNVLKQWQELVTDMYGDDKSLKNELVTLALNDEKVSQIAKNWLKQISQ